MTNAFDCGGMLLVIAEEKVALIIMPVSNSDGGIILPNSLKIIVLLFITKRMVWLRLAQFLQLEYETIINLELLLKLTFSIKPLERLFDKKSEKKLSIFTPRCFFSIIFIGNVR